ncbi:MAG: nucleotide pyrophosphohydrolase [Saprospiraceae bacterium]|nr:nucleotide pyrophosphohydrolase [Saprospiraceae bacterium]
MEISALQSQVDKWIKTYGVRYFNEMTNTVILMEEVGELSRLMARQYGEQSFKEGKIPPNIQDNISDELGDIVFVLTCLANQMGIDLEEAIIKNLNKKTSRDKDRHISNKKL